MAKEDKTTVPQVSKSAGLRGGERSAG